MGLRNTLRHRGPDGHRRLELLNERCQLGHNRLSVIDLEGSGSDAARLEQRLVDGGGGRRQVDGAGTGSGTVIAHANFRGCDCERSAVCVDPRLGEPRADSGGDAARRLNWSRVLGRKYWLGRNRNG